MNKKTKTFLYIILFAIFILVVGVSYNYFSGRYQAKKPLSNIESQKTPISSPEGTDIQSKNEGELMSAVDFTAYDKEGKKVRLSDYEGTPLVLNFWASWCTKCKEEMPYFNKVSEEYSKTEILFLMVDMVDGKRETVESGKKHIEENKYTFTVLYDTDQNAAAAYEVRSIPSTIFINREGYAEAGVEGEIDEETLRRGIDMIVP